METRNLKNHKPKTVVDAAEVKLALVTYVGPNGAEITQPVLVGRKNAHLLDAKAFGFGKVATPVGPAQDWLRDEIFKKLGASPDILEELAKEADAKKAPKKGSKS